MTSVEMSMFWLELNDNLRNLTHCELLLSPQERGFGFSSHQDGHCCCPSAVMIQNEGGKAAGRKLKRVRCSSLWFHMQTLNRCSLSAPPLHRQKNSNWFFIAPGSRTAQNDWSCFAERFITLKKEFELPESERQITEQKRLESSWSDSWLAR